MFLKMSAALWQSTWSNWPRIVSYCSTVGGGQLGKKIKKIKKLQSNFVGPLKCLIFFPLKLTTK